MLQITPQERLALGVTALLLASGAGVRILALSDPEARWEETPPPSDTSGVSALLQRADAQAERDRVRSTPLAAGERIDPNRASADELDRLPRVGPALAQRIVQWRDRHGPFRTLDDLDSVPGIGPGLLGTLEPHLALSRAPAPRRGEARPLDLNRATAAELEALPGIGPVLAERIVQWRSSHGPFRSIEDLQAVPGIGPGMLARIAPGLRVQP